MRHRLAGYSVDQVAVAIRLAMNSRLVVTVNR